MPLMYGEGDYAFTRLREHIDKGYVEDAALDETLSALPVASEAAFNSFNKQHEPTCLPNTRTELLHDIAQWTDGLDDKCIYWLSGIAGTGKSTVARTVARRCHERGRLGASFFFSKGGGDLNNATKLVTTIARQLATAIPATKRHICEAIMRQKHIAEHSYWDQWDQLIIGPLSQLHGHSSPPTIVIVADALDECESERDIRALLRVFPTARSLTKVRLRLLLTSRPEIAIRHSLGGIPDAEREIFALHEISPDLVNRDLSLFFESNFSAIREERGLDQDWPGKRVIERLVEISCGLFIWASIACRFIREGRRLTMRRVSILLDGHRTDAGPEKQLDQIYTDVIRDSIRKDYNYEEKAEICIILREVLGSIVVLAAPLSMLSLASLLGMPLSDIKETLLDLHTIFHIPSQPTWPIRLHHPTFRDFLLDEERCGDLDFSVNEKQAHRDLAEGCLRVMSKMLKRDICELGSPGTLVKDVDAERVRRHIPDHLQYACLYWVQHYRSSGLVLSDDGQVATLFREHFLHWVEAICLMGKSSEMGAMIRLYHSMLEVCYHIRQLPFVKDARRWFFAFQNIIKQAPLQVYGAALAFARPNNRLKQHFRGHMHPWIKDIWVAPADVREAKDEFNYVNDLAFTPDGRQVASGSNTEIARLWDVPSKSALWKFEGPTDKVSSVSISPDGTLIAAGSDDFGVMVWDLNTRAVRYALRKAHSRWVNSVAFSPDGKVLASGSMDETVALWDAATGSELRRFDNQSSCVNTAAFSPDGSLIATGSVDQMIRVWDVSGESEQLCMVLDGHLGCINCVRFSPTGERLVSGSDDMTVRVWDLATKTELMSMSGHTKKVMAVTFSLDAQLIVSGAEDMTVRVWDASNGTALHTLKGHTSGINAVVFSPSGTLLASASFDDDMRLWDAETFAPCGQLEDFDFKAHSSSVTFMTFSPDGRFLASGSEDGAVKLWPKDGGGKNLALRGHRSRIHHLAFSPCGRVMASASSDKTVSVWDTATGTKLHTLVGHSAGVFRVLFSPDGELLASCSADTTTRIWDVESGAALATFAAHQGVVTDLCFSPDGLSLASCSADTTVVVWCFESGAARAVLQGHLAQVNSVAFSYGEGELLASCSEDATIRVWDWRQGATVRVIKGEQPIKCVSFSRDCTLLVSALADGRVGIWECETGLSKGLVETGVVVRRVCFSDDGRYVHTDHGTLDTSSFPLDGRPSSSFVCSTPPCSSRTVFATSNWVKRDEENLIWVPDEYAASAVAACDGSVAMGHSSGAVSVISVDEA
ncbi:WD40-repeat-containing domain protein [Chaetomium fimeti]|uniref:WD40-repeat-containing domain protein n=1 Tax=Chaetomium fimeti TaxID=1854472 RepID=A0AAE0LWD9_9PEZI|nr:WD40-repeat-containing domain protein [Chaetomium fimeti]